MRRNGRKEVTMICFEGVAADGGFVFRTFELFPNIGNNKTKTAFKMTAYADGVIEIAIDCTESIPRVAELVSGMFSRKSNFANLDSVILNYRNIRLQIGRSTGRKDIICMLIKAMSASDYKNGNNDVFVDTQTCQKENPLRDSDRLNMRYNIYNNSFWFDEIVKWSKNLWFKNTDARETILISSIKDGIVKFFVPYSNFYGVKAIEVRFYQFSIRIDEQNSDRILYLYKRSCDMSRVLWKKEMQEYYNSPKYIEDHTKSLKKKNRKKVLVYKVRQFQKKNADFTIVDKKKQEEWENCKNSYSDCIINYVILWAQYMEYLMDKYNKKLSEVWDMRSDLEELYDITGFMYGYAVSILSSFWKYGEELRVLYNSKYNYEGDGVVNPVILI